MSYLEVYAVRSNGNVEFYGEAHNAFGGAMHIWMALKDKYKTSGGIIEGFKVLWNSIGKMNEADQWVLASTFDNVIIPKEHLGTLIRHLTTFVDTASHSTLLEEIEILKRALVDNDVQGVAFNQTSTNADMWRVALPDGEDEEESTRPYNINQDEGHWYLTPEYIQSKQ